MSFWSISMNVISVVCVAVCIAAPSSAQEQTAPAPQPSFFEGRNWTAGLLLGNDFNNNKRFGIGFRAGFAFLDVLYLGATAIIHGGSSVMLRNVQVQPNVRADRIEATVNSWYVGPELGADIPMGNGNLLRPYIGAGFLLANSQYTVTNGTASQTTSADISPRLYFAPGLLYTIALDKRYSIGFDGRYQLVSGADGGDYTSLGLFLALTVRF
jgi:hypothetical protein